MSFDRKNFNVSLSLLEIKTTSVWQTFLENETKVWNYFNVLAQKYTSIRKIASYVLRTIDCDKFQFERFEGGDDSYQHRIVRNFETILILILLYISIVS